MPQRTPAGHWTKGTSGNPGGRPRVAADVRAALEALTPRAVEVLAALLGSDDERIRLRAAETVLNRTMPPVVADVAADDAVDTVDFVPVFRPADPCADSPAGVAPTR
jgi:hypothetical protein